MAPKFSKEEWTRDGSVPWKARVCRACAPDPALFPLIVSITGVVAMIPKGMPQYVMPGTIAKDGTVYFQLQGWGQKSTNLRAIGSIEAVRDYCRRLADHCRLDDEERIEFFDEIRKSFKDLRAESNLDVKRHN